MNCLKAIVLLLPAYAWYPHRQRRAAAIHDVRAAVRWVRDHVRQYVASRVLVLPDTPHSFWMFDPWLQPTVDAIAAFPNPPRPPAAVP